jgi:predicted Zn-dependent protease
MEKILPFIFGRAVAANIFASYKPYTADPELSRSLNLICQSFLFNSPDIKLFDGCYVIILDSPELNAFASPGGHIFINRGFVEAAKSEDMLAAIIAHELAHIKLKHGALVVRDMRLSEMMMAISNQAAEFTEKDSTEEQRLMNFRASIAAVIDKMMKNRYSLSQEMEADIEAVGLLTLSGYYPRALIEILQILEETQNSRNNGINTTHPSPSQRIANIEKLLKKQ